jgi:hypothetical protein
MQHAVRIKSNTGTTLLVLKYILHSSVHACSELGSLYSNAPQSNSSIIGLESNVIAVKSMYPAHKVVAIVGHGKCLFLYTNLAEIACSVR